MKKTLAALAVACLLTLPAIVPALAKDGPVQVYIHSEGIYDNSADQAEPTQENNASARKTDQAKRKFMNRPSHYGSSYGSMLVNFTVGQSASEYDF